MLTAIAAARARRDFMVANPPFSQDDKCGALVEKKEIVAALMEAEEQELPGDMALERSDKCNTGARVCLKNCVISSCGHNNPISLQGSSA